MIERFQFPSLSTAIVSVSLLSVTAFGTGPLLVGAAHAQGAKGDAAAENVFFSSSYGYCDAKKVARVWKTDVEGGKVVIGRKIMAGLTNLADADIASASGVRCDCDETGLTFDDAQRLAKYWGRSVVASKAKALDLVSAMGSKKFQDTILSRIR